LSSHYKTNRYDNFTINLNDTLLGKDGISYKSVMQHFNNIHSHLGLEVARKIIIVSSLHSFLHNFASCLHSQCQGFCIVSKLFLIFIIFCSVTLLSIASPSIFHLFTFAFGLLQFASFALWIYVMCTPLLLYYITIAINCTFSSQLSCFYYLIVVSLFATFHKELWHFIFLTIIL
jgi:hypothetical protein